MKYLFRFLIFVGISLSLIACGSSVTTAPPPTQSPNATSTETPASTPLPSPSATLMVKPTATRGYIPPTLIPTIDPPLVPDLLSNAFSVHTMEGINGHTIQQITGWDYRFGGGIWQTSCPGFVLLDDTHVLLYPAAGQVDGPEGSWTAVNTVPQPVVINLESGSSWQPPVKPLEYPGSCNTIYWSEELGLLIAPRLENDIPNLTTYKVDGRKVADYRGNQWNISPSGTKIMIDEDTLVDLRINTRTKFSWPRFEAEESWYGEYYWSYPDETKVYHCCSYYADLSKGKSFRFIVNPDFQLSEIRNAEDYFSNDRLPPYMNGQWVRDNTFFLVRWSWIDDGDMRYLPMFSPNDMAIYDVRGEAGISPDLSCHDTTASSSHVWLECDDKNYLINLYTFEATEYPGFSNLDVAWSADERFVWLQNYDSPSKASYYMVSTSSKELEKLPVKAAPFDWHDLTWHPVDHVLSYLSEDQQKLGLVNAQTMSIQEISLSTTFREYVWSTDGEKIALIAQDGSLWQADYPELENLEQLTEPMPEVHEVYWSADGTSIAFIGGSDIYIVKANK